LETNVVAVQAGQDHEDDRHWEDIFVEFAKGRLFLFRVNVNDSFCRALLGAGVNVGRVNVVDGRLLFKVGFEAHCGWRCKNAKNLKMIENFDQLKSLLSTLEERLLLMNELN
jgi:hypothetical protein